MKNKGNRPEPKTKMRKSVLTLMLLVCALNIQAQQLLFGGDYPDPTIVRDGDDYYMTHSGFEYLPGLLVWHSRDLQHWEPVGSALHEYLGSIWAPDICKYDGRYWIYFTIAMGGGKYRTYMVSAENPKGPWTSPVDVGTDGVIDPCHVVDDRTGQRWLYTSGGHRYRLSADGARVVGARQHVYDGWPLPKDWLIESGAFEGPKIYHIDGWWYYLAAIGGTAGPPTSHCVSVARARTLDGPWENSPQNPLVHTWSINEQWWSKGHGSLIDDKQGHWSVVYHAYERNHLSLGRQTLVSPVSIDADGWFVLNERKDVSAGTTDNIEALARFDTDRAWRFFKQYDTSRFVTGDHSITIKGEGDDIGHSHPLLFVGGRHAYEFTVKVKSRGDVKAGVCLFYNPDFYVAYTLSAGLCESWKNGKRRSKAGNKAHYQYLKLRNNHQTVSAYRSTDGENWVLDSRACEVSGYSHHTLGDFLSLLPGIFVSGDGEATFSDFQYKVLE